jgi:AcrR family transcriptional regulator
MSPAEKPGIGAEMMADPVVRRRPADPERRQELIKAAETVFLQQGFAAANMDDVVRGARMSKKTLYQLFPSKEALFEAVIADHLAPLITFTPEEEGDDPRDSLTALLLMAAKRLLDWKQIGMFRLISGEGARSPELAQAFHRAGPGRGEGSLERCIAAHARKGKLQVHDPGEAAGMLFGMAIGKMHMMLMLGLREQPSPEEIASQVERAVEIFLHGTEPR